ncbi:MAG: hypothetical protein A3B68_09530 [Candidatus Melainabacteria bacterium RIFCSPHIGHO2_02_FULL_34_12]|nr:MAG: hypothetical protein A3B68_09530 [Candidatus Melainabacteria bacterium RIFCSPHIGHO2_02_FULL_34_12]
MKTISKFLGFIFFLIIFVVILFNLSNQISVETSFLSLKTNIGFLIFASTVLSCIGTILLGYSQGIFFKSDRKLKNQIESTKLSYETETEKVKQLEAKIKTLEEALKMASRK